MKKGNSAGWLGILGLGLCILLGLMFNGIAQQPTKITAEPSGRSVAVELNQQDALAERITTLEEQVQALTFRIAALEAQAGVSVAPPTTAPSAAGEIVTSTPAPTPTTAPLDVESLTTQGANIRSGPGTEYAVMRTVQANAPVDIMGYNDDKGKVWYALQGGGWISGDLVNNRPSGVVYVAAPAMPPPPPTNTPAAPPPPPPPTDTPVVGAAPPTPCHASYDPCVPIASDADCAGGSGNGPVYVDGPVKVIGPDDYDLDRDGDGWGCE